MGRQFTSFSGRQVILFKRIFANSLLRRMQQSKPTKVDKLARHPHNRAIFRKNRNVRAVCQQNQKSRAKKNTHTHIQSSRSSWRCQQYQPLLFAVPMVFLNLCCYSTSSGCYGILIVLLVVATVGVGPAVVCLSRTHRAAPQTDAAEPGFMNCTDRMVVIISPVDPA